ncbi:MAG: acetylglutamate kinase [Thermoflavifilum sp.]|nr:acetylglutamate kinase [Thermoflavifilum sp.]MCL6514774.1 acetylglutamate kinase [Alicyclobacillus sp.]
MSQQPVLIKVGGSLQADAVAALVQAIRAAHAAGRTAVVVHGGGPRITAALKAAGLDLPFVSGRRVTTDEAMPIVERALAEVGAELAASLAAGGVRVRQMSGAAGWLRAQPLPGMARTADIAAVDAGPLGAALSAGEVPVVAPIACDEAGVTYNVNADVAAGAVARAVAADRAVFLTDVDGILRGWPEGERIAEADEVTLRTWLVDGTLSAGMIPKVEAALAATAGGVTAYLVNGRDAAAVTWAVTSEQADAPRFGTRIPAKLQGQAVPAASPEGEVAAP